jgi:hypothetical protein
LPYEALVFRIGAAERIVRSGLGRRHMLVNCTTELFCGRRD